MKKYLKIIWSFGSTVFATIVFWYTQKDQLFNAMGITFEWKYLIVGLSFGLFMFGLFSVIKYYVSQTIKETIFKVEDHRWNFIKDAIMEKIFQKNEDEFLKFLFEAKNNDGEFKYNDELLESIGMSKKEIRGFRDAMGAANLLETYLNKKEKKKPNESD